MDYGIIGCGSAHILADDNDGYLRCGEDVLGKVYRDTTGEFMAMKVKGNDQTYAHRSVFRSLNKFDAELIGKAKDSNGNSFKLIVVAKDRFDFGATIYTRFVLVKAHLNEMMITPPTLYQRTCDHRNDASMNCGILYDKDGKEHTVDFAIGKNGIYHSNDGKSDIIYTTVNSHIIAAKVPRLAIRRENWLDKVWHIFDDVQDKFSYYNLHKDEACFAIPISVYNDIVKQILKADKINRKTILEVLLLGNLRCPNADMVEVLIPLINAALKTAAVIETRIATILKDTATHLNNGFKEGSVVVNPQESVMMKITRAFFGNHDMDMELLSEQPIDLGF